MGRRSKVVANMFAVYQQAAEAERRLAEFAVTLADEDKRRLFRDWWAKAAAAQAAGRYVRACPSYLRGLTCGARKKNGERCASTTLCANGRCKFHGGASTGPRSPEGRAKALENLRLGRMGRGDS